MPLNLSQDEPFADITAANQGRHGPQSDLGGGWREKTGHLRSGCPFDFWPLGDGVWRIVGR
jgi:hypothetical protein